MNYNQFPPIRIGFIGGGINSAVGYVHYASSQLDGLFRLEAGSFSRNKEVNKKTAEQYGINSDRLYDNWKDLIESEYSRLDAVVVLTPIPTHWEIISELLVAGFPVISEKALVLSVNECLTLRKHLKDTEGFLAVTYNYSGYPMFRELVARYKAGELGELHQIQAEMPQEGFLRRKQDNQGPTPQAWRCVDYELPTVSLDLGAHLHHLVDVVSGGLKPLKVTAFQSHSGLVRNVVDNVNALVQYENGLLVNMWYGKSALGLRNGLRLRVFGSKGSGEWLQSEPEKLILARADGSVSMLDPGSPGLLEASKSRYQRFKPGHPSGFIEAFANLYADIAAAFWQRRETNAVHIGSVRGLDHSLEGLSLLEAIHESACSGCWITPRSSR